MKTRVLNISVLSNLFKKKEINSINKIKINKLNKNLFKNLIIKTVFYKILRPIDYFVNSACAAANLATGTLKGEQET